MVVQLLNLEQLTRSSSFSRASPLTHASRWRYERPESPGLSTCPRSGTGLDWDKVRTSPLPLFVLSLAHTPVETLSALSTWQRRHEDARKAHSQYTNAQVKVRSHSPALHGKHSHNYGQLDFNRYRDLLQNKSIVDELEKKRSSYKPQSYNVDEIIDLTYQFETIALRESDDAEDAILSEVYLCDQAIEDIKTARPVEDLHHDDVLNADPKLEDIVVTRIKRGEYHVPGYDEKCVPCSALDRHPLKQRAQTRQHG